MECTAYSHMRARDCARCMWTIAKAWLCALIAFGGELVDTIRKAEIANCAKWTYAHASAQSFLRHSARCAPYVGRPYVTYVRLHCMRSNIS